jgi:ABC-2 type transport system permease protein
MIGGIARVTARQLLGRRRTALLALAAAIPILLAVVLRLAGGDDPDVHDGFVDGVLIGLVVTLLMPLAALILGTTVFGAEIDDGTVVYLLAKPIPRRTIVLVKWLVAAVVAATLTAIATLIAGAIGLAGATDGLQLAAGYAVAVAVGSVVYVAAFVALSLVTSRALIVGLVYVLVWEGALAGSFPGIRFLSVRQYVLAIADAVGGGGRGGDTLEPAVAAVLSVVVVVVALVVAIRRLETFEIPQSD